MYINMENGTFGRRGWAVMMGSNEASHNWGKHIDRVPPRWNLEMLFHLQSDFKICKIWILLNLYDLKYSNKNCKSPIERCFNIKQDRYTNYYIYKLYKLYNSMSCTLRGSFEAYVFPMWHGYWNLWDHLNSWSGLSLLDTASEFSVGISHWVTSCFSSAPTQVGLLTAQKVTLIS